MKDAILWKRILNEGIVCAAAEPAYLERLARRVITAPIIVDGRTQDEDAEEGKAFRWDTFKGLSVPFPRFWCEGSTTKGLLYGMIVELAHALDVGWAGWVTSIVAKPNWPVALMGAVQIAIGNDGDVIYPRLGTEKFVISAPFVIDPSTSDHFAQIHWSSLDSLFDLLLILGCKNVGLEPRNNDQKQVTRAIKRYGGNADKYRYHVLVVRPPGAKPGSKGEEIGVMPRHVCRGHFSEYGPEFNKGLLFGKYAGRFYIPPHMKGDKKNGEVVKDYAVPDRAEVPHGH